MADQGHPQLSKHCALSSSTLAAYGPSRTSHFALCLCCACCTCLKRDDCLAQIAEDSKPALQLVELPCRAQVPCVFGVGVNDSSALTADVYLSRDLIKQLNADGWTHTLLLDAQPGPPQHQHQCVHVSFAAVTFLAVSNAVRHALEPDSKSARQISYAVLHRFSEHKDKFESNGGKRTLLNCKPLEQVGQRTKQRRVTAVLHEQRAALRKHAADEADASRLEAEVLHRSGSSQQLLRSKPQVRLAERKIMHLLSFYVSRSTLCAVMVGMRCVHALSLLHITCRQDAPCKQLITT